MAQYLLDNLRGGWIISASFFEFGFLIFISVPSRKFINISKKQVHQSKPGYLLPAGIFLTRKFQIYGSLDPK
jgi:hypothetical protein